MRTKFKLPLALHTDKGALVDKGHRCTSSSKVPTGWGGVAHSEWKHIKTSVWTIERCALCWAPFVAVQVGEKTPTRAVTLSSSMGSERTSKLFCSNLACEVLGKEQFSPNNSNMLKTEINTSSWTEPELRVQGQLPLERSGSKGTTVFIAKNLKLGETLKQ